MTFKVAKTTTTQIVKEYALTTTELRDLLFEHFGKPAGKVSCRTYDTDWDEDIAVELTITETQVLEEGDDA